MKRSMLSTGAFIVTECSGRYKRQCQVLVFGEKLRPDPQSRSTRRAASGMASRMMTQWHFVIAAYVLTALGTTAVLAHSWLRMRSAERRADALRGSRAGDADA